MKGIFAIGLAVFLTACNNKTQLAELAASAGEHSAPGDFAVPRDAKGIVTLKVQARPVQRWLEITGRIQADPARVIRVFPPVTGRLLTVLVRPGDHVRQGQALATLESSEVSAARADCRKARTDAELKEKALRRAALLYEHQVLSEREDQQAQADFQMAQAELERALERLKVLGVPIDDNSDQLHVIAPRAGVVLDIGAAPGELSKSLDSPLPLCTLANLGQIWVVGDVYEKDLASLKVGQAAEVTVNAYPGEKWSGRIMSLSDTVDPTMRTLKVRVTLPNPGGRLKPDMFASIRLFGPSEQGIVVPTAAVIRSGSSAVIFVRTTSGHFERRSVVLGQAVGNSDVKVVSGLNPGEVIVTEGSLLLRTPAS